MNYIVIQPPYAHDAAKIGESVAWEIDALANGCSMVQLFKPHFGQESVDRAKAAGLRCNVFWSDDPGEARRFLNMGIDTILTNDYQPIADATGLK